MLKCVEVLQLGSDLAAAVAGRLFADLGAAVTTIDPPLDTPLARFLNLNKTAANCSLEASPGSLQALIGASDLAILGVDPPRLDALQLMPDALGSAKKRSSTSRRSV